MTEGGGVEVEFVNVSEGLGVELASRVGVDARGVGMGWNWGLASGVWGGFWTDGSHAVVA